MEIEITENWLTSVLNIELISKINKINVTYELIFFSKYLS